MTSYFYVSKEVFLNSTNKEECYKDYELNYKPKGFLLSKEVDAVYIIIEKDFNINIGDDIDLYGLRKVHSKFIDVVDDTTTYYLDPKYED